MAIDGEVLGSAGSGAAAGAQVGGPWGAVIGGGIGLASGLAGSGSRRRAEEALRRARQRAIGYQQEARDTTYRREQPWEAAGRQGLNALQDFNYRPTTAEDVRSDAGYQFTLGEGLRGVEGGAAARGGLYSGAAGKELLDYSQGTANRFFTDAFNRNQTDTTNRFNRANVLSGYGERSVGRQNAAGTHFADMAGGYETGYGNTSAAGSLAGGRAEQNALGQFGGGLFDLFSNGGGGMKTGSNVPVTPGRLDPNAPSGSYGYYKDGGPVMEMRDGRMVPKVGTRSPRPGAAGATGGGMSREAILQALDAPASAPAAAPRQQQTMRHLQIEKALKDANAYARGGPVKKRKNYMGGGKVTGPGGPRSDSVPAWLSPGEHVVTSDEVMALGGGDPMRGHNALLQFRGAL